MKVKCAMNTTFASKLMWFLALLLLASAGAGAEKQPSWSQLGSFGGSGEDGLGAAKTDAEGNLYMTGFFSATASFQKKVLVSYGDADVYLAKFGPHGRLQWIVQAGGTGLDEGSDLAFDAKGNVYVTGWFSDSATFQSADGSRKTVTGYVHENIFLAKYSPTGRLIWLRIGGSPVFYDGNNRAWGLAVNPRQGSVYITGFAQGTTYFSTRAGPNQAVTGPDTWHMYLVKYDTQGNFHWGVTNTAEANSIAYKVAVDSRDHAYVVGWFEGDTTFSSTDGKDQTVAAFSGPIQSYPDYPDDAFLVKYDGNGSLDWVNHAGGYKAIANNLAVSDEGRISITGLVGNTNTGSASQAETIVTSQPGGADVNLGGGQFTIPYNWDVFIATFDHFGVLKHATRIGGTNEDFGSGIAYDNHGNLYVTGFFSGLVDFGGLTLNGTAPNNVFVVKYQHHTHHGDGSRLAWAKIAAGAGTPASYQETGPRVWVEDSARCHDLHEQGNRIVVSGPYQGTATFSRFKLNSVGADDIYLMELIQEEDSR
jgi:hypothetical protein